MIFYFFISSERQLLFSSLLLLLTTFFFFLSTQNFYFHGYVPEGCVLLSGLNAFVYLIVCFCLLQLLLESRECLFSQIFTTQNVHPFDWFSPLFSASAVCWWWGQRLYKKRETVLLGVPGTSSHFVDIVMKLLLCDEVELFSGSAPPTVPLPLLCLSSLNMGWVWSRRRRRKDEESWVKQRLMVVLNSYKSSKHTRTHTHWQFNNV